MGENGVSSSWSAAWMVEDFTPGVKMEEKSVTSSSKDLLSLGWSRDSLCECWMSSLCCLICSIAQLEVEF